MKDDLEIRRAMIERMWKQGQQHDLDLNPRPFRLNLVWVLVALLTLLFFLGILFGR